MADVMYHVPTGFGFSLKANCFFMFLFLCPQYLSTESVVGAKKLVAVSQLPLTLNLKNLIL